MGKFADRYLKVCPWEVVEEGFRPEYGRVSESIFSLGNEYMGVRGYFDEGYGGDRLVGSYFNGIFEREKVNLLSEYKGMVTHACYMINTVDWLYARIAIDGEPLDLARSETDGFTRRLDMKKGTLTRTFTWKTASGKVLRLSFERFLSMSHPKLSCQRVSLEAVDFSGTVSIKTGLDFSPVHEGAGRSLWDCVKKGKEGSVIGILGGTAGSGHRILSACRINGVASGDMRRIEDEKFIGYHLNINLSQGEKKSFEKMVVNHTEKDAVVPVEKVWKDGMEEAAKYGALTYDAALSEQAGYWAEAWKKSDIVIEGDPENQQGIRYCIFQLHQTYHGEDPGLNIGAKGLTGEAYGGNAFWDTETYCLPFYIFNNPRAARNLLEYRYRTLPKAMERAGELDCEGAFYPIATLDGGENCALWQHSSLQLQAGTAVAYGIWHYQKIIGDRAFLYSKGVEILVQVSRMLASRGQWGQKTGKFGFYSVMGPDEFQMMVNNNCYTNVMGKKTFEYTLEVLEEMKDGDSAQFHEICRKLGIKGEETNTWKRMAGDMYIPFDETTGLYEQQDGFFNLPHIDIGRIPVEDFPLYHNWSYDRIYRNDMIKQPDVLMFMFLYNQEFTREIKRANYEYYEPRCIHESSLSPSIHSIFASELGRHEEAFDFFGFATRMDLDNYNRNTREGLHTTSIAAAWMNIVYGFGGMRSDGERLLFNPSIPESWSSYSFNILYRGAAISVRVSRGRVVFKTAGGDEIGVTVYGREIAVGPEGVALDMPGEWIG